MQVDAIEQRPRHARAIAVDGLRQAAALAAIVAGPAARAGIHRGHELEARRVRRARTGARNNDGARLEGFAQHLQRVVAPLGQLVEEQHAVVRKRDFARARVGPAADQGDRAAGVVRRAEWTQPPTGRIDAVPADGGDCRGLERFGFARFRQQAGQARGEQRLAAARRADEDEVVLARGGDLQGTPRPRLPTHVAQVRRLAFDHRHRFRTRQGLLARQRRADFQQRPRDDDIGGGNERGLGAVGLGHDQPSLRFRGRDRRRQHAVHGAQLAGQPKLAEELHFAQGVVGQLPARREDAEGDRQVEPPAALGQVRRRQVDGDAAVGEGELRALQCGAHAVLGFAHAGMW